MKQVMQDFMAKLQNGPQMQQQVGFDDENNRQNVGARPAVTNESRPIPLKQRDVYPESIPLDMHKGGPAIPLKSKDEVMVDQLVDQYEVLTESFIQRSGAYLEESKQWVWPIFKPLINVIINCFKLYEI